MKRRIKQNVWGNINGYEGSKKVIEFGTDERRAEEWLKGSDGQAFFPEEHVMKLTSTAKKIKRIKLPSLRPPREIQEKTKERRAWLAEQLALVQAMPNREAKIVGTGSYQSISVYELVEQEGRVRHRGNCQFCGHEQVVDGKLLVLHGYKRPGDGAIYNRCPGMSLPPLQLDKSHTEKWLADAQVVLKTATSHEDLAKHQMELARDVWRNSNEYSNDEVFLKRPHFPSIPESRLTPAERERRKQLWQVWAKSYPITAAKEEKERQHSKAVQAVWQAESNVRHFKTLLEWNLTGKPLKEEVVV